MPPRALTSVGDTDARYGGAGIFFIDHVSTQISIDGVGTFDFVTPTRNFVNQNAPIAGWSRAPGRGA